jgi:hypothetical protein
VVTIHNHNRFFFSCFKRESYSSQRYVKSRCPNAKKASLHLIKGVFENTNYHEWIGPKIFQIYGKPQTINLKTCTENESKKIYEIAEEIYKNLTN